ncbi:MAG: cell division protein FtsW [Flavobacteriales bacterium]|nr:FtsW/RodA/SpoVE family cell cycle protein [Bacteroidales bacterium AH-315-I05]PCJ89028.1 MAG: cell division protein FtsW [Flavobacteriales bacterium]
MNTIYNHIKGDKAIWFVVLLLAILSLLVVYSSIVTLAYRHHEGNTLYYLFRHSMFVIVGIGIIYAIHRVKYTYFSRISQLALYISIPLLILTLIIGANINEASRWLVIPVINQTFQTSDLAKLALIMYIARMLSLRQDEIKDFKRAFLPVVIPVLIVCALILPANFSTAAALFASCIVLMFIGRISLKHIISLIGIGIAGIALVLGLATIFPNMFPRAETWVNRIENFQRNDSKSNYQVEQSKIAIATGGIAGKGPGKSTQRNFLPHPYSDFIYAIVIEEYGLIGGFGVVLLYLILLYRSIRIVIKSPKTFGALLAIGISFSLVFQAMINMAVAVNLLPVTGQPLPMVSMGGTSIWFTCLAIGIILSVSVEVENGIKIKGNQYATA